MQKQEEHWEPPKGQSRLPVTSETAGATQGNPASKKPKGTGGGMKEEGEERRGGKMGRGERGGREKEEEEEGRKEEEKKGREKEGEEEGRERTNSSNALWQTLVALVCNCSYSARSLKVQGHLRQLSETPNKKLPKGGLWLWGI